MRDVPPKENRMGTMPIKPLLLSMSVPMILSMLVQALYNVVDSIFVARLSEEALTAVSLAFPAQNLMIGVAVGTGVGVNALLSKSLGEKNLDVANKTANNSILLAVGSYLVFALLGIFGARSFMEFQTDIPEIYQNGTLYLTICFVLSFGVFFQLCFDKLLQSTGKTFYTMITQLTGAIINIILDPLLIFGIGPFPRLEVAGAAYATVIGQIVAAGLSVYLNLTKNREIRLRLRDIRPNGWIIKKIYGVGIPSIIMSSVGSVMTFGMNYILLAFTPTAAAVLGVYFKLQSFIFMPVFGLNNGMVPIISYNYGAKRVDRITQTAKYSVLYATIMMLTGLAVFWVIPGPLLSLFKASPSMLEIGIPALRTISLSFVFAGFCIVSLSVFQALGHGILSLTVSVVRQLVVLLPVAYLLSRIGLSAVWFAVPIAEIFSVALCIFFMRHIYSREIAPLKHPGGATPYAKQ